MKILNGRWVNDKEDPLDYFETKSIKSLGKKIKSIYGNKITYNRISIISSLSTLDYKIERAFTNIIKDESLIKKLSEF